MNNFEITNNNTTLFTPGPINTAPSVRQVMNVDIGSRTNTVSALTSYLQKSLLDIADNSDDFSCIMLQGSGTFAIEAMITSLISTSDKLLVIINGTYSQRMANICDIYQIPHVKLYCDETKSYCLTEIEVTLKSESTITKIAAVHFETSLGVLNDIDSLADLAEKFQCGLIVDAISTFAAIPINYTKNAIIASTASANKCLHSTPGIAFVFIRNNILQEKTPARSLSLDLKAQWHYFKKTKQWRFTPPTHILLALHEAIQNYLQTGGLEPKFNHYTMLNRILVKRFAQLDIHPIIKECYRAPMVTAFMLSEKFTFNTYHLFNELEKLGLIIYASNHIPKKSFRVGCIGELKLDDINELCDAIAHIKIVSRRV